MKSHYNKIVNYTAVLVWIVILSSCISTTSLTIEIPQQSKKELPDEIQSLTLVNRTVDASFTNHVSDSLQKQFYQKRFNHDTIINDIQASDTTLIALGDLLFESGRYDIVIPEERFLKFQKNSFLTNEMPWNEVDELCQTYNTDAVLSLDHFKTRVTTSYSKEEYFDPTIDGFTSVSIGQIVIFYETLFRVYDPENEKILAREFIRDTVIWEATSANARLLFDRLTPIKTALSEAGIAAAIDFTDIISTVWNENTRKYFVKGDSRLKHAKSLVDNEQWDSAIALWREIARKSKSKSIKSKAEFNLALAFELQGNLPQAISWALKSYDTMYRPITYKYLEILERRRNDLKK